MPRFRRPGRPPDRPPGRRMPPPEETAEEARYLDRLRERKTPVVVHLADGSSVGGRIEYFDTDMIKITLPRGPHRFVRKTDVRYIEEATERR